MYHAAAAFAAKEALLFFSIALPFPKAFTLILLQTRSGPLLQKTSA